MNRDYIDNIYPQQMESSLMKGIDSYNRPFIAIKLFPRDLYEKILRRNGSRGCLTLVALARTKYFPPDIARLICTFMEYRSISEYNNYFSDNKITESRGDLDKQLTLPKVLSLKNFKKSNQCSHNFPALYYYWIRTISLFTQKIGHCMHDIDGKCWI